jgi:hypothetical protein
MKIEDLNGHKLKKILEKDFGSVRVIKTYHNKHVDNSGNFGFVIVKVWRQHKKDEPLTNRKVSDETWFTLNGEYDSNGEVNRLWFGEYGYGGRSVNVSINFDQMVSDIKEFMIDHISKLVEKELSKN